MSSHVQTFNGILIKTAALCMHGHGADLVWFGYLTACQAKKKKKKDGGPGQKKPSAASAAQQHQKPNENVQLLPELRTMKSQIALLKYFTQAHTLHLLNGANQKKCESTHYVGIGRRVGESSCSQRNTFLISTDKQVSCNFQVAVVKDIIFRLELTAIP